MKLSVAMVLDHVAQTIKQQPIIHVKNNLFFSGFRPLLNESENRIKDYAYVVPYDQYEKMNKDYKKYKSYFIIFANEDETLNFEKDQCQLNTIIISGMKQVDLYNTLIDLHFKLNDWNEHINTALVENQSIQTLANLSREILKNPFIIFDPQYSVLAYTDNPAKNDEGFFMIVDRGYTPPVILAEIMQLHNNHHNIGLKTFIEKGKLKSPYIKTLFPIKVNNVVVATVCMHYTVCEISQGLIDLQNHFIKKLSICFKKIAPDNLALNRVYADYEQLFTYILNHTIDEEDIEHIADITGIPVHASFRLFVINLPSSPMRKYILNRVSERMPTLKCIIYDQCVMLVSIFSSKYRKEGEFTDSMYDTLNKLLNEMSCICGSSRAFYNICELRNAYIQASKAAEIGNKIRNLKNPLFFPKIEDTNIYEYNNLYFYHMIECTSKEVTLESLCAPELLKLIAYDEKNGTDNYKVLYTYLESSKKTVETANILHMHRNNVNYRIKRIEELFDINLDDSEFCLKLQLSFRVLDLMPKKQ